MKKRVIVAVSLGLALVAGALAVWLFSLSSSAAISVTVLNYTQWPHGAKLRLSNRTNRTITHFVNPVLCLERTPGSPTNNSPALRRVSALDSRTRQTRDVFYLADSWSSLNAGAHLSI